MFRVSAHHGNEGEEEQGEDQDDLATGEPKFSFTIGFDCQDIEEAERNRLAWSIQNANVPAQDGRLDTIW